MGSKRKSVCDLPSTSEEDEGSDRKKRPVLKTFRIYSTEYVTSSNRDEKKMASAKIVLNENTTEREIREILTRELPQLRGNRFKFFTKDGAGKWYFCPCSLKCEGKDHLAEWNGRNISKAAKSNRTVYILIESTTMEQTRSRGVENDTPTNPVPIGPQFRSTVGQHSSNPWDQKQVRVVAKNLQSVSCPDLSLSGLKHQKITLVQPLSAKHGNDLNQWPTQVIHLSKETEYGKVKDGGRVTEEKDGEGEARIDMGDEEMQTDTWNSNLASTSGYDTFSPDTNVPSEDLSLPMSDEELQPYLDSVLPSPTPTLLMEIVNGESTRNPFVIEEIVPIKGDIKGGDSFVLCFAEPCMVDHCQVRFGIADPVTVIRRGNDYRGKTPPYPTPGEVQVQLVNLSKDPLSDTVTFTYTDESAMKKWAIKPQDIQNMAADDLPSALLQIAYRMGQMRLQPRENANQPEDANTEAMLLLRIIADTAAKINAIDFFRIVFSTNVGHSVFKCFKDEQPLLEDIAKRNGHNELASLLEEKHLMYQDDESDSDDEVDWKELVKAMEQWQTLNGETNEKKSIRSAISSETMYGYLGDGGSSTTLSSSDFSVAEGFPKDTLEDQDRAPLKSKCPEEPNTRCARCERLGATAEKKSTPSTSSSEQIQDHLGDGEISTSLLYLHLSDVEGCAQSTFEDQQTTQESMYGEESNTCQSTVAEDCPENTLEDQQTIPKSKCREKPDTCRTSGRIAIGDGVSDTDIINAISSSDQLRMNKAHQVKESQSSIGEKNELANIHVNPLHLVVSGPIIMESFQMDKFAPKEISSLRRKLGSFDAAKMNPSALYPDGDQTIYNLMERLDTPPELDFLEKLKQDSTRGLNAQKGSQHLETAEKELCDVKRKGATVMKTESITSLYSPLQSKVESGVEIATLAGSESNVSLEEQSAEVEISQDARFFDERKSACLSFLRTRRLACACLLTSLLTIVVCLATIFTLGASIKTQTPTTTPTTAVGTMTTSRQACSNGLLTLLCEGVTDLNAVHELRWKIKFPDGGWNEFAYCGKSDMNCVVTRPELPEGIKVLEVSNRSVNIQRVAKNNTSGYAQTMCQVLYSENSRTSHVYKINFTAKCVRIHEHRDLNLTKILQSFVQCERAVDIEWYSINGSKFVHCSTCQDCKKISQVNREHVFWSRLKVTRDSLLLTAIQGSDDGWTITVKVHMKASGKSAGRDVEANMASAHMYTIWIFVNTSRPPVPEKENKSLCGSPPKVCRVGANFPCKLEQIHWNTTVGKRPKCFDCPDCLPGTEPSIPCGTSVDEWPEIHCVLCELGKTYSDKDDTSHCKTCTICSKGKAVKNNCTLTANTECDNKCKSGFYTVPLISGCFPCTRCCGDGKDEFAAECANNEKMCKVRYTPCTRFQTKPSKPTKRNYSTSNTSPAVKKGGKRTTMDVNEEEDLSVSGELSISVTPSSASDNEMPKDEIVESEKRDGLSIVLILLIITVALCGVLFISITVKRVMRVGNMLQSSRKQDSNNEGCNISQGGTPPLSHSSHRGDVTLEELEEKHFTVFERMCKDLNNRRPGERWDFEHLASCYDKISLTDRNSLKNEFQNDRGNPSDVLMSHIKTKYPDHIVRHLVRNLKSIGRDDIARRLMPYTLRKPSSTQGY